MPTPQVAHIASDRVPFPPPATSSSQSTWPKLLPNPFPQSRVLTPLKTPSLPHLSLSTRAIPGHIQRRPPSLPHKHGNALHYDPDDPPKLAKTRSSPPQHCRSAGSHPLRLLRSHAPSTPPKSPESMHGSYIESLNFPSLSGCEPRLAPPLCFAQPPSPHPKTHPSRQTAPPDPIAMQPTKKTGEPCTPLSNFLPPPRVQVLDCPSFGKALTYRFHGRPYPPPAKPPRSNDNSHSRTPALPLARSPPHPSANEDPIHATRKSTASDHPPPEHVPPFQRSHPRWAERSRTAPD